MALSTQVLLALLLQAVTSASGHAIHPSRGRPSIRAETTSPLTNCALFARSVLAANDTLPVNGTEPEPPYDLNPPGNGTLAPPIRPGPPPEIFPPQPDAGPGGSTYRDSAHFRLFYNASRSPISAVDEALRTLEGTFDCLIGDHGWRSTGLSYYLNRGYPGQERFSNYYKTNIDAVPKIGDGRVAGVMNVAREQGASWIQVEDTYLNDAFLLSHEYGHALHFHQRAWEQEQNARSWWETVANWVADMYVMSPLCEAARARHNQSGRDWFTNIELGRVVGESYRVIVDATPDGTQNYYQAWPFFTYLTNNPDHIPGLGTDAMRQLMVQYPENANETPLHTLQRVLDSAPDSNNITVGEVVGRYWTRMAHVDIGHAQASQAWLGQRWWMTFDNIERTGSATGVNGTVVNTYKPKDGRSARYMGANLIQLVTRGTVGSKEVTVRVKINTTYSSGSYTAAMAVRNIYDGTVRYVELVDGAGSVTAKITDEEVALVVANTPRKLIMYDGYQVRGHQVDVGMEFSFELTGATVMSPYWGESE
ncbi:uncharacterized protein B0I36DRAFT_343239 [Microdochium trichocladiopsis]|uniref:Dockerin type 1 n=1 Tax=Microdochium trichocladiopsis TaxID=1682393 RepID=A0A9P8XP80_9PEZI|nr:uncharacterized protein B0I36DRAFT_343239 [Microdochium trichocladiopsis]KAH7007901.1 hypothetical protein B0I36DRAFT_343239 [Microdochium trichocladiopsis]